MRKRGFAAFILTVVSVLAEGFEASIADAVRDLEDPSFEVRERAFARLMEWTDRFPEDLLAAIPRDPADPEAAFRCRQIRERIAFDGNPLWKEAFAATGKTPEVRRALEALAASPCASSMKELTRAAGPRATLFWRAIAAHLDHPGVAVRMAAIQELSRLGAPEAATRLIRVLSEDKHPRVRREAAESLGRMRCREAVPGLVECMKEKHVRGTAQVALSRIGDLMTASHLPSLLADPRADVRKCALELLNRMEIADPAIAPAVAECLADPDGGNQYGAFQYLERVAGEDWQQAPLRKRVQLARDWWAAHRDEPRFKKGE